MSNKNHPPQVPSLHNTLESRIIGGVGIKGGGFGHWVGHCNNY